MKHLLREHQIADSVPLIERVEAVDGNELNIDNLIARGHITNFAYQRLKNIPLEEKFYGMDLTKGALGCALSHRYVWEKIVARKHKCALIMEDDVELSPLFSSTITQRIIDVPGDWELLYLGGVDLLSAGKPPRPMVARGWRRAYSGQRELTAYVLHHVSAALCLELTNKLNWQIDTHLCESCTDDIDSNRPYKAMDKNLDTREFRKDSHSALDKFISKPMSYALQPTLAIQLSRFGTNVQKSSESSTGDAYAVDAKRRVREFYSGLTSVR